MGRDEGLGARGEGVPATPHAGRYFVTDAILLAGEIEVTEPIRSVDQAGYALNNETFRLHLLVSDHENWESPPHPARPRFLKNEQLRLRLLRIAATAMQAAKQLGLDSRQDAIAQEIPF